MSAFVEKVVLVIGGRGVCLCVCVCMYGAVWYVVWWKNSFIRFFFLFINTQTCILLVEIYICWEKAIDIYMTKQTETETETDIHIDDIIIFLADIFFWCSFSFGNDIRINVDDDDVWWPRFCSCKFKDNLNFRMKKKSFLLKLMKNEIFRMNGFFFSKKNLIRSEKKKTPTMFDHKGQRSIWPLLLLLFIRKVIWNGQQMSTSESFFLCIIWPYLSEIQWVRESENVEIQCDRMMMMIMVFHRNENEKKIPYNQ